MKHQFEEAKERFLNDPSTQERWQERLGDVVHHAIYETNPSLGGPLHDTYGDLWRFEIAEYVDPQHPETVVDHLTHVIATYVKEHHPELPAQIARQNDRDSVPVFLTDPVANELLQDGKLFDLLEKTPHQERPAAHEPEPPSSRLSPLAEDASPPSEPAQPERHLRGRLSGLLKGWGKGGA